MKKAIIDFWSEKQGVILRIFLGAIMALFIGILVAVYFVAKQANPIFLDEKGKPVQTQSESHSY
jgi:uncharacterized membrane protein YraQ (UPF0718 family)